MRWILGLLLLLATSLWGGFHYLKNYPAKKYGQWIQGQNFDRYYSLEKFKTLYLAPTGIDEIPPYQEDYTQLWKEFPIGNTIVPLPTRHPLFQSVPIIDLTNKQAKPNLGISFLQPNGREISRIYTLPQRLYQDHSLGQELFKLPYVSNRLRMKNIDDLWVDLFSYKVGQKSQLDDMIYDLYILHVRSKILPIETLRYGMMKDGKLAMIELTSKDKDYKVELVLIQKSGNVFSYVLRTESANPESLKLRSKFLNSINFGPKDEAISRMLYTEFKQLNYARQVDQEGMLYLFSAWSQNTDSLELLKEMIYYLERGQQTKKQLSALYRYSFKKYGKTFTSRKDVADVDDPELILQRNIELEEKANYKKAEEAQNQVPEAPALTPDEKMNLYLKKAKEQKAKEAESMTVH